MFDRRRQRGQWFAVGEPCCHRKQSERSWGLLGAPLCRGPLIYYKPICPYLGFFGKLLV